MINNDVRQCDYFILVLWDRWGSPPHVNSGAMSFTSGCEEEFAVARECLNNPAMPMKDIVVLFKGVDERQLSDPGEQLSKVLSFKKKLEAEKALLYKTFDKVDEFKEIVRHHLAKWSLDQDKKRPTEERKTSTNSDTPDNPAEFLSNEDKIRRAEYLAEHGHTTDAERIFATVITSNPEPNFLIRYGKYLRRHDRLSLAKDMFSRARNLATEQGDRRTACDAIANLGVVARKARRFTEARQHFSEAISIASELEDGLDLVAYCTGNLSQILRSERDLSGAFEMQEKAIHAQEALQEWAGLTNSYGSLGVILRELGRIDNAEEAHRKGIKAAEKAHGEDRKRGEAYNYGSLGYILLEKGFLDEAESSLRKALQINRDLSRSDGISLNVAHLAILYQERGEIQRALETLEEAFKIDSLGKRIDRLANNYVHKAALLLLKEDTTGAAEAAASARLLTAARNTVTLCRLLLVEGDLEISRGNKLTAVEKWREAQETAERECRHELRLMAALSKRLSLPPSP
mgnify:CR=1 FL=1